MIEIYNCLYLEIATLQGLSRSADVLPDLGNSEAVMLLVSSFTACAVMLSTEPPLCFLLGR